MIDVKCLTDLDLPGAKVTDAAMLKEHSGTLLGCEAFARLKWDGAKRHSVYNPETPRPGDAPRRRSFQSTRWPRVF
jgi:hypothetical protein